MESNDENWIYFITAQSRYRSRRIDAVSSSRGSWEFSYMTKTILQSTTAPRIGKYRAVSQSFLVPFFFLFN